MRLSDILSKSPNDTAQEIDGFLDGKKLPQGKQRKISIGKIGLSFFCKSCQDTLTFFSDENLYCIGIDEKSISIDCVLTCQKCGTTVPVWFLVRSDKEIFSKNPKVKLYKRVFKLSKHVSLEENQFKDFEEMLEKADIAYFEELGAGSVIYLRKIIEQITKKVGDLAGVSPINRKNKRKTFRALLEEVNEATPFIPNEFSKDGYRLFRELSGVIHGDSDEQLAMQKYLALRRLVVGILQNVKNNQEMMAAINALGWKNEGEPHE